MPQAGYGEAVLCNGSLAWAKPCLCADLPALNAHLMPKAGYGEADLNPTHVAGAAYVVGVRCARCRRLEPRPRAPGMYACMHVCVCVYVCMHVCMHACMSAPRAAGGCPSPHVDV